MLLLFISYFAGFAAAVEIGRDSAIRDIAEGACCCHPESAPDSCLAESPACFEAAGNFAATPGWECSAAYYSACSYLAVDTSGFAATSGVDTAGNFRRMDLSAAASDSVPAGSSDYRNCHKALRAVGRQAEPEVGEPAAVVQASRPDLLRKDYSVVVLKNSEQKAVECFADHFLKKDC